MKPYAEYKPSGIPWHQGQIPKHWEPKRVIHVASMRSGEGVTSDDIEETGNYPVYGGNGIRGYAEQATHNGEFVLIGRQGALCGNVHYVQGEFWASEHAVVSEMYAGDKARWAAYILEYMNLGQYSMAAAQPGLAVDKIQQLRFPVPPPNEQQAIAAYLDTETARIDTLIREKEGLIGLLREWRGAVISELTSGLNFPGSKTYTGNVHMPHVPSEWSMVRLGKYAKIGNGSTPLKDNASYWQGGTFPWLNSAVVNLDEVTEGSEFVTEIALQACHLPIVEAGALLVALTGQGKTRGQVTMLRITATINQHLAFIASDPEAFDSGYLHWTLTGLYGALRMVSDGQGGTKGALTCEDLSRFQVPKPPIDVQKQIALRLADETANINKLVAHTLTEIDLLQELRAATIADAVLGRIDVRTETQP